MRYLLKKSFTTRVERSPRVLEIAEAFGIGLADKEFTVYDGTELEIAAGQVVYITGQSGSGKSLALRLLADAMRANGLKVGDLGAVELEDKPVIELVGKSTAEATQILAAAGISDAWIYIRKPSELSDGQRYRLRLALLVEQGTDVWIADEFGAVLDRVTAKCVAFTMAKLARRLGKTFMVATTHTDLVDELAPDVTIRKLFRERVEVTTKSLGDELVEAMADALEHVRATTQAPGEPSCPPKKAKPRPKKPSATPRPASSAPASTRSRKAARPAPSAGSTGGE